LRRDTVRVPYSPVYSDDEREDSWGGATSPFELALLKEGLP
jgi:hypothetical protein